VCTDPDEGKEKTMSDREIGNRLRFLAHYFGVPVTCPEVAANGNVAERLLLSVAGRDVDLSVCKYGCGGRKPYVLAVVDGVAVFDTDGGWRFGETYGIDDSMRLLLPVVNACGASIHEPSNKHVERVLSELDEGEEVAP